MRKSCQLVIDLSAVEFLGSAGLTVLLEANDRQRACGQHLALVVADNRMAARPLEVTSLTQVLDMHPTVEAAAAACLTTARTDETP